jgi:hypothetical protein
MHHNHSINWLASLHEPQSKLQAFSTKLSLFNAAIQQQLAKQMHSSMCHLSQKTTKNVTMYRVACLVAQCLARSSDMQASSCGGGGLLFGGKTAALVLCELTADKRRPHMHNER